ncbi:MAG: hypothetical protein RBT69_08630 [Spirochaetia bacterium]|jgi:hypothetical protein|nr:hypothetical protein [Spirochaetia bacterium]
MKETKKKIITVAAVFLMAVLTVPVSAQDVDKSIAEGKMPAIEYKIVLNENALKFPVNDSGEPVLTAAIAKEFSDLGIIFEADKTPVKKYYYMYALDKKGEFQDKGLIFRVREDRKKPAKSKVTLKSRQNSFEALDFATVDDVEYEFDAGAEGKPINDRKKITHVYNTAFDFKYSPEKDFSAANGDLEFKKVWNWLESITSGEITSMLMKNYPSIVDASFPGFVDAGKFEGTYADTQKPLLGDIEFSIDYWTLKKNNKERKVVEISFSNEEDLSVENKKVYDMFYLELYKKLYDKGYVNKDQSSKTDIYLQFFK